MAALPDLITVAQYRQIPPAGDKIYELHHGEVVVVSRPKAWHWLMQKRLEKLLEVRLEAFVVGIEFPFRAIPEFDVRAGDVVAVRRERFAAMDQ